MGEIVQFPVQLEHMDEKTFVDGSKSLVIVDEIRNSGEPWALADANTAIAIIRMAQRIKQA